MMIPEPSEHGPIRKVRVRVVPPVCSRTIVTRGMRCIGVKDATADIKATVTSSSATTAKTSAAAAATAKVSAQQTPPEW